MQQSYYPKYLPYLHQVLLKTICVSLLIPSFLFVGCQTLRDSGSEVELPPNHLEIQSQAFKATFEETWQAVHIAMLRYRLQIDNQETGIVGTEMSPDSPAYQPPFSISSAKSGRRSQIEVRLLRGKLGRVPSTRVIIQKRIERQTSIVDEAESIASDGWEERALLYRIHRELLIFRGLQRHQKHQEQKQRQAVEDGDEAS